jgi:hypothetical protein
MGEASIKQASGGNRPSDRFHRRDGGTCGELPTLATNFVPIENGFYFTLRI